MNMSLVGTVLRFIKDKVDVVINFIRSLMFSQNAVQLNFTLTEVDIDSGATELPKQTGSHPRMCRSRYGNFIHVCSPSAMPRKTKQDRSREPSCVPDKRLRRLMLKSKTVRKMIRVHVRKFVPKSSILHEHTKRSSALFTRLIYEQGSFSNKFTKRARSIRQKGKMQPYRRRNAKQKLASSKKYFRPASFTKQHAHVYKNGLHQFSHVKRVLSDDIELNPGPGFVSSLRTVKGDFHQGNVSLFGNNSGKQCPVRQKCRLRLVPRPVGNCSCFKTRRLDYLNPVANSFLYAVCTYSYSMVVGD